MTALTINELRLDANYALFSDAALKSRPLIRMERKLTTNDLNSLKQVAVRRSPFAPAYARIVEFSQLPKDWDTYGAEAITPQAVEQAAFLLDALHASALASARVCDRGELSTRSDRPCRPGRQAPGNH